MTNGLWSAFAETGEPLCYLLLKAAERNAEKSGGAENAKESAAEVKAGTGEPGA